MERCNHECVSYRITLADEECVKRKLSTYELSKDKNIKKMLLKDADFENVSD